MGDILVVHPGPLGDVLLAVPALRALRGQAPAARIVLAAQSHVGELLRALGVADATVRFESLGLDSLFTRDGLDDRAAMLARADRVVCWFGSRDPTFVTRIAGIQPRATVAPPWTGDDLVWRHLVATAGAPPDTADREAIRVPSDLVHEGRRALEGAGWDGAGPLLVVHPGASGGGKRWSADGYAEVVTRVRAGRRIALVVHEGPADRDAVAALLPRLAPGVSMLTNPALPVLAGALVHARAFLGNDSGISHLAAAVGAPALILFTPAARPWAPWSPRARALTVSTTGSGRDDVAAVSAALGELVA